MRWAATALRAFLWGLFSQLGRAFERALFR